MNITANMPAQNKVARKRQAYRPNPGDSAKADAIKRRPVYTCPELGRTSNRPGAYDAYDLPSVGPVYSDWIEYEKEHGIRPNRTAATAWLKEVQGGK